AERTITPFFVGMMEGYDETPFFVDSGILCPNSHSGTAVSDWAYLHKSIISIVMGSLMSAAGVVLFLLQFCKMVQAGPVASACVSVGLMFVVVGLVWIPILKEKRRRRFSKSLGRNKQSIIHTHNNTCGQN
uniref:Uncharacterized protein n=1 Tax=Hippocampus comes TaxID=109280 RepID=A0A3Q3E1M2_HIPCM